MYLSHYGLTEKPFKINPDPKFMWLGETHKEALAILKYGILDSRGFLLLIGDVGTGKTTLINGLLNSLDEDTIVATVSDPGLEQLDFYNFLANAFKIEKKFSTKGDFLVYFIHFLHKAHAGNKRVLVIIDEAQRLTDEMLEEIRLLSNIEKQDARLLNIFLVGQNELNGTLAKTENRALLQRITTRYNIGPLKKNEVAEYIKFRLKVAGTQKIIFSPGAIRQIISFSKCYPRLINIICDQALLTGFVKGVSKIDTGILKECAKELRPPKKSLKERGKILISIRKVIQKPSWKLPASIALGILFLIMAGYFSFQKGLAKRSLNMGYKETDRSSFKADQSENLDLKQKIQTPSKRREPLLKSDLIQKNNTSMISATKIGTDVHTLPKDSAVRAESKTVTNKGAKSTVSDFKAGKQQDLLIRKNKQNFTRSVQSSPLLADNKLIINFALNSNEFTNEAYELLDRFVDTIFQNPDTDVIIKGYTDSSGNYNYNKQLSRFRANIVKSYFVGQGVSPKRLKTYGMGPENPIASNATKAGRSANRRIEIELKRNKPPK